MDFTTLLSESLPYLPHYGLALAFIGGFLESEIILLLAGILCHRGLLPTEWVLFFSILGAFVGDQFWFLLGKRYGKDVLSRFPRLAKQANRVQPWLDRKPDLIAFGSRFVFGSRAVAPILLGMNNFSPIRFALLNIASAILWAGLTFSTGYLVGISVERYIGWIEHIELLLVIIALFMLAIWWYRHRKFTKPVSDSPINSHIN